MAKPGPKPGFKRVKAVLETALPTPLEDAPVSASDRENPQKLTGQALRELGYRRGLARSHLASMSDEKIREQLRYLTYRQYEDEAA